MGFVEEDIERVRAATSIVEVIQGYVALRKAGRNWVGLCPFHAEKVVHSTCVKKHRVTNVSVVKLLGTSSLLYKRLNILTFQLRLKN